MRCSGGQPSSHPVAAGGSPVSVAQALWGSPRLDPASPEPHAPRGEACRAAPAKNGSRRRPPPPRRNSSAWPLHFLACCCRDAPGAQKYMQRAVFGTGNVVVQGSSNFSGRGRARRHAQQLAQQNSPAGWMRWECKCRGGMLQQYMDASGVQNAAGVVARVHYEKRAG